MQARPGRIQERLDAYSALEVRMVVNIPRGTSTVVADHIREAYHQRTWQKLWDAKRWRPSCYSDPRCLDLGRKRSTVFHIECCVADAVWGHFDRLIRRQPPSLAPIDEPLTPPFPPDHGHQ